METKKKPTFKHYALVFFMFGSLFLVIASAGMGLAWLFEGTGTQIVKSVNEAKLPVKVTIQIEKTK